MPTKQIYSTLGRWHEMIEREKEKIIVCKDILSGNRYTNYDIRDIRLELRCAQHALKNLLDDKSYLNTIKNEFTEIKKIYCK